MNETSEKDRLRRELRSLRRDHVAALDPATRALLFMRPPRAVVDLLPNSGPIGLYRAMPGEASATGYAKWLLEEGRTIALPRFAHRGAPMEFAEWTDPFEEDDLEVGPFGLLQPLASAPALHPVALFAPLLGFTAEGDRIGQGAGHYDRWLADHPGTPTIGLAWDAQLCESLPTEAHDQPLTAIVTPTRLYGPFDAD